MTSDGQKIFPQFKEACVIKLIDWLLEQPNMGMIQVINGEEDVVFLHSKTNNNYLLIKSPTIVNEEV